MIVDLHLRNTLSKYVESLRVRHVETRVYTGKGETGRLGKLEYEVPLGERHGTEARDKDYKV